MKLPLIIALSALTLPSMAAEKYICTHTDAVRTIEVVYTSANSSVPCNVEYTKKDSVQILWSAQNQAGFCESKALAFSEKLTGYGWSCTYDETKPMTEKPAHIADTQTETQSDLAPSLKLMPQ